MDSPKLDAKGIGERIRKLREKAKISQQELGKNLKLSQTRISRYERGFSAPPLKVLIKLAEIFKVSLDYLLFGTAPPVPYSPTLKVYMVERWRQAFERFEHIDNFLPLPLLADSVAAGPPREINPEDIEGFALIHASWCSNPENYTVVRVIGNSMYPLLEDGSLVAINHAKRDPKELDGKIVAFRKDGGVSIKMCQYLAPDLVVGRPYNQESREILVFRGEEVENCIVGVVEWWWRRQK